MYIVFHFQCLWPRTFNPFYHPCLIITYIVYSGIVYALIPLNNKIRLFVTSNIPCSWMSKENVFLPVEIETIWNGGGGSVKRVSPKYQSSRLDFVHIRLCDLNEAVSLIYSVSHRWFDSCFTDRYVLLSRYALPYFVLLFCDYISKK